MNRRLKNRGITLLETLIAMSIMATTMGVAYFMMNGRDARVQLKTQTRDIASYMKLARTGAIRDSRPWAIQFEPGNQRYVIFNDSGEVSGSEDWGDGDEGVYRIVNLPAGVFYGSHHGEYDDISSDPGNGVTFSQERAVYNPNGTAEAGAVYLKVVGGETCAVVTSSFTGRVKIWSNYGSGWSDR